MLQLKEDVPTSQDDYDKRVEKFYTEYVQLPEAVEKENCHEISTVIESKINNHTYETNIDESESSTCCYLTVCCPNPFSFFATKRVESQNSVGPDCYDANIIPKVSDFNNVWIINEIQLENLKKKK